MNARILLVEDDPVSRDLLAALLTLRGYEVDAAADGFDGLRLAQEQPYGLVLVDYHLPEMDGYAFARLMRSTGERDGQKLKMIAITADQFGLAARRGADAVFDRILTKPIDPDILQACVESFLPLADDANDALSGIDAFLAPPAEPEIQTAAQVLWRVRGLSSLPKAAIVPDPTPAERQGLEFCFSVTAPDDADCLFVLNDDGLAPLAAFRETGRRYWLPVLAIGDKAAVARDAVFDPGDGESWSDAAARFIKTRSMEAQLKEDARSSPDAATRLLVYLAISGQAIKLRRDSAGRTSVAFSAGFDPAAVIAAVKALAAKGLVKPSLSDPGEDGIKELSIRAEPKGISTVLDLGAEPQSATAG